MTGKEIENCLAGPLTQRKINIVYTKKQNKELPLNRVVQFHPILYFPYQIFHKG